MRELSRRICKAFNSYHSLIKINNSGVTARHSATAVLSSRTRCCWAHVHTRNIYHSLVIFIKIKTISRGKYFKAFQEPQSKWKYVAVDVWNTWNVFVVDGIQYVPANNQGSELCVLIGTAGYFVLFSDLYSIKSEENLNYMIYLDFYFTIFS